LEEEMANKTMLEVAFDQTGWIMTNRKVAKYLSANASILLGELIHQRKYFREEKGLPEDQDVYSSMEQLEELTGLARRQQEKAIELLENWRFIRVYRAGVLGIRHFHINDDIFEKFLLKDDPVCPAEQTSLYKKDNVQNVQTTMYKPYKQECTNRTTKNKRIRIRDKEEENYNIAEAAENTGKKGIVDEQGNKLKGKDAIKVVLEGIKRIEEEERRRSEEVAKPTFKTTEEANAFIDEYKEIEQDAADDTFDKSKYENETVSKPTKAEVEAFINTYQKAHKERFGREFVMSKGHRKNVEDTLSEYLETLNSVPLIEAFFAWCSKDDGTVEHLYEKHSDMSPSVLLQESVLQRFIKYIESSKVEEPK
jgi:hypothetical protein